METVIHGNMNKASALVFIPAPWIGHLVSMVEMAKIMIERDTRLHITVMIMILPFDTTIRAYTESLSSSTKTQRLHFVYLTPNDSESEQLASAGPGEIMFYLLESNKPRVRDAVTQLVLSNSGTDSPRLVGFVLDVFCTSMIDVANEFGVPTYVFYTSSAGFLDVMFHLQTLCDEHGVHVTEFKDSDVELTIPSFVNPVPAKVLPSAILIKEGETIFLDQAKRLRQIQGIMVNTFMELDSNAIKALSNSGIPQVYPVGPILNLKSWALGESDGTQQHEEIIKWLDEQPPSSVLFLCFGSQGCFGGDQVKEIARALESSGHRFLWSVRRPPSKDKNKIDFPTDYTDLEEVLPEGFLDRTAKIGKVIGWAPQVAVLAHPATSGFLSHCGWNSILESLWFGVPIATWPLYAEQQFNAFELVKEFGLAVEIRLDYRGDIMMESGGIVGAEEIERGIRRVMEHDSDVRKKVKEMKDKSRRALMEGGSSYVWLGRLIDDVIHNMP